MQTADSTVVAASDPLPNAMQTLSRILVLAIPFGRVSELVEI